MKIGTLRLSESSHTAMHALRIQLELNHDITTPSPKTLDDLTELIFRAKQSSNVKVKKALSTFAETLTQDQQGFFSALGLKLVSGADAPSEHTSSGSKKVYRGVVVSDQSDTHGSNQKSKRIYRGQVIED